jgi:hypothetical protein
VVRVKDVPLETIQVPVKAPDYIPTEYDEELFNLCRNDDYRGLYEALIRRVAAANGHKL